MRITSLLIKLRWQIKEVHIKGICNYLIAKIVLKLVDHSQRYKQIDGCKSRNSQIKTKRNA